MLQDAAEGKRKGCMDEKFLYFINVWILRTQSYLIYPKIQDKRKMIEFEPIMKEKRAE